MKKILVNLLNHTPFLNLQDAIVRRLQTDFPENQIIYAFSKKDMPMLLKDADLCLSWYFETEWYREAPKLKAVITPAAGHDWVSPDPSLKVQNIYGHFHGAMMTQSLLGMLLYFNRKFYHLKKNQDRHVWDRNAQAGCRLLKDQTILIIGYGTIGKSFAEVMSVFGPDIYGLQREKTSGIDSNGTKFITQNDLHTILPQADHVAIILPGTAENDNFLNQKHFKLMKKSTYVYNIGRSNCINEADLIHALKNGEIAGAGLDVFNHEPLPSDSPLWDMDNVLITPHSACAYENYADEFYIEARDKIIDLFS